MNQWGLRWFPLIELSYPKDENRRLVGTQCPGCSKSRDPTDSFCSYTSWCQSGVKTTMNQGALWASEPWGPLSSRLKTMVGYSTLHKVLHTSSSCCNDNSILSISAFINFIWQFHIGIKCSIITLSPTLLLPPSYPYSQVLYEKNWDVILR